MRTVRILVSCIALFLALAAFAFGDVVYMKGGGKFKGEIVKKTDTHVQIQTKFGLQTISRDKIDRIEYGESDKVESYESRRAKIKRGDAEAHYQLGLWCKEKGRADNAKREFRDAVRYDSNHAGARKELGYVRHGGRWIPPEKLQPFLDKGLVVHDGRLVTPEVKARLEAEEKPPDDETSGPDEKKSTGDEEKDDEPKKIIERHLPWDKAKTKTSTHYKIISNVDPRVLKRYEKLLERMYSQYRRLLKGELKDKSKLDVTIYAKRSEYEAHVEKSRAGEGGAYSVEKKRVIIFHGYKNGTDTTETVLKRECARQFEDLVFINIYMAPVWLTEGIIAYFEVARVDEKGRVKAGPPPPRNLVTQIRDAINRNKHDSMRVLIRRQRYRFSPGNNAVWASDRLMSWSLVFFMVHGGSKHRKQLDEFISKCIRTRTQPETFERLVGDIGTLEAAWKNYFLKVKLPPPGVIKGNTFTSDELGVEMEKPNASWKFTGEGDGSGFQVGITDGKSRADLYMYANNQKYTTSDFATHRGRIVRESFNYVKEEETTLGKKKAVSFKYAEANRRRGRSADGKAWSYIRYVYAGKTDVYEFVLKAPEGKAAEYAADFEKIINGFKFKKKKEK
jgi:hypothetical protein